MLSSARLIGASAAITTSSARKLTACFLFMLAFAGFTAYGQEPTVTLSVSDASVNEGTGFTLTGTLSAPYTADVVIDIAVSGTADANDRTVAASQMTVSIGETTATIAVTTIADNLFEPGGDETVIVDIASVLNGTESGGLQQTTTNIVDQDSSPAVTLTADAGPIAEAAGSGQFTATLSNASTQAVIVNLAFTGTATSSTDYTTSGSSIIIAAGFTTGNITVTAVQDDIFETSTAETIIVDIDGVTNGSEGSPNQQTIAITDDDSQPSVTLTADAGPLAENGGTGQFTATLSNPSVETVTVTLGYTGTANNPADYTRTGTSIAIAAGFTTGNVTVTSVDDNVFETTTDETIIVDITNVTNGSEDGPQQQTIAIDDDETQPTVTLTSAGATIAENGGVGQFTATLSNPSVEVVTVTIGFTGTATNTDDYTRSGTSILISALSTTGTITVTGVDDDIFETSTDETIIADITGVTNGTESGVQQRTIGVVDDDPQPTISVSDATVSEDHVSLQLTVTISNPSVQTINVNFDTVDVTAAAGSDYDAASGQLTFVTLDTIEFITIPITNDTLDEPVENEFFAVLLTAPVNATINDGLGFVEIEDNDDTPTISISDAVVSESVGTFQLTVTMTGLSEGAVVVNYQTVNGAASSGSDYTASTSSVSWAPGTEGTRTFNLTIASDSVAEKTEEFSVSLDSDDDVIFTDDVGTVTISDDDLPVLTATAVPGSATEEGNGNAIVTVSIAGVTDNVVSVAFSTVDGTATAGTDYTNSSSTISWASGDTSSRTISIPLIDDSLDEPGANETYTLDFAAPTNGTINVSEIGLALIDNDATPTITISDFDITEANANAVLTLTLTGQSQEVISVRFDTADDTATAGSDYTAVVNRTITWAAEATGTITTTVGVLEDTTDEADPETFFANLTNAVNATISDAQGVVRIADDDDPPTISISSETTSEDVESGLVTLTVSLSNASALDVTVAFSSTGASAVSGADFTGVSGVLSWAANSSPVDQYIVVPIINDTIGETDEIFTVVLQNATNATLEVATGVVTIVESRIRITDVSFSEDVGNAVVTVQRLISSIDLGATVDFATADGTADSSDYTSTSGTLTFGVGSSTQTFIVPILPDNLDEPNSETFFVNFSNATTADFETSQTSITATIVDAEETPALEIDKISDTNGGGTSTSVTEGGTDGVDTPDTTVVFEVSLLNNESAQSILVDWALVPDTATDSGTFQDVVAASGTLSWAPGEGGTKTLSITIEADLIDEDNETFSIDLSNIRTDSVVNFSPVAVFNKSKEVITIVDDDLTPKLLLVDAAEGLAEDLDGDGILHVQEDATNGTRKDFSVTLRLENASDKHVFVIFETGDLTPTNLRNKAFGTTGESSENFADFDYKQITQAYNYTLDNVALPFLHWSPGETGDLTVTFSGMITNDDIDEESQEFGISWSILTSHDSIAQKFENEFNGFELDGSEAFAPSIDGSSDTSAIVEIADGDDDLSPTLLVTSTVDSVEVDHGVSLTPTFQLREGQQAGVNMVVFGKTEKVLNISFALSQFTNDSFAASGLEGRPATIGLDFASVISVTNQLDTPLRWLSETVSPTIAVTVDTISDFDDEYALDGDGNAVDIVEWFQLLIVDSLNVNTSGAATTNVGITNDNDKQLFIMQGKITPDGRIRRIAGTPRYVVIGYTEPNDDTRFGRIVYVLDYGGKGRFSRSYQVVSFDGLPEDPLDVPNQAGSGPVALPPLSIQVTSDGDAVMGYYNDASSGIGRYAVLSGKAKAMPGTDVSFPFALSGITVADIPFENNTDIVLDSDYVLGTNGKLSLRFNKTATQFLEGDRPNRPSGFLLQRLALTEVLRYYEELFQRLGFNRSDSGRGTKTNPFAQ